MIKAPTFRQSFDRMVERCIANREIYSDLYRLCKATGEDYNAVVEHIVSEIRAN